MNRKSPKQIKEYLRLSFSQYNDYLEQWRESGFHIDDNDSGYTLDHLNQFISVLLENSVDIDQFFFRFSHFLLKFVSQFKSIAPDKIKNNETFGNIYYYVFELINDNAELLASDVSYLDTILSIISHSPFDDSDKNFEYIFYFLSMFQAIFIKQRCDSSLFGMHDLIELMVMNLPNYKTHMDNIFNAIRVHSSLKNSKQKSDVVDLEPFPR